MRIIYILLLLNIALCVIMFLYFKWYVKKRTSGAGFLLEYRDEINRLKAEIDVVTERNITLVEESIKNLKEIQDDADRRVSNYVNELEKSRQGEALYTNLGRGIRAALNTEAMHTDTPPLSVLRPNLASAAPTAPAAPVEQKPPPLSAESKPLPVATEQKPVSKRQIRVFIDQLANEGIPPQEIASRLDISIAEVDLAMNLRSRK